MGIDCIIDYDCKVREALTPDGMVSMIKNRNRAVTAVQMLKKEGKTDEEVLNTTFKFHMLTLEGEPEIKDYKVSDLLKSTLPLEDMQNDCEPCPAGGGKPFGCYTTINYPISGKAESWLADTSRKALEKGAPNSMILNYIIDRKVTGGSFDRMRKDPGSIFFELKEPLEIAINRSFFSEKSVNTDQIFNIIFGTGMMKNPHMMMLLYFSGGLLIRKNEPEQGTVRQEVKITDKDGKESWMVFHLEDKDTDDSSIYQLKEFFRVLFIAYGLDKEMIIGI